MMRTMEIGDGLSGRRTRPFENVCGRMLGCDDPRFVDHGITLEDPFTNREMLVTETGEHVLAGKRACGPSARDDSVPRDMSSSDSRMSGESAALRGAVSARACRHVATTRRSAGERRGEFRPPG